MTIMLRLLVGRISTRQAGLGASMGVPLDMKSAPLGGAGLVHGRNRAAGVVAAGRLLVDLRLRSCGRMVSFTGCVHALERCYERGLMAPPSPPNVRVCWAVVLGSLTIVGASTTLMCWY